MIIMAKKKKNPWYWFGLSREGAWALVVIVGTIIVVVLDKLGYI